MTARKDLQRRLAALEPKPVSRQGVAEAAQRVRQKLATIAERSPLDTAPTTLNEAYARILVGRPADPTSDEANEAVTNRVFEALARVRDQARRTWGPR